MPRFRFEDEDFVETTVHGRREVALKKKALEKLNPMLLGLGPIGASSTPLEAVCAIFDLEGFTSFCGQLDPHLVIPEFLNAFLDWIYGQIRKEMVGEETTHGSLPIYHHPPLLHKFLGDGLMLLWDHAAMRPHELGNLLINLNTIVVEYQSDFVPRVKRSVANPPPRLRCGVARGVAYSVGNAADYVGPCINLASRLQKLAGLTFVFSRRGINYEKEMNEQAAAFYVTKQTAIRGLGQRELVVVRRDEVSRLSEEEQASFSDP